MIPGSEKLSENSDGNDVRSRQYRQRMWPTAFEHSCLHDLNCENLMQKASSMCSCRSCADLLTRFLVFRHAVARKELEECLWSWPNSRVLTMSRRRELQLRKVRDDAAGC
ncbi:hypothetical protein BD410DRAFT_787222 [Rickenella mellea]|uniref:Uncharacterized protein n=1 Tax=Rickenella mellea TaxID=50990 RepID=A0A4Y7Q6Z2_9AGAM|nr:hypothetical protein BD410DRAFT_787222 [Rickenella mellea]